MRDRLHITEKKLKDSEKTIDDTYLVKIDMMEKKNQELMDKIAGEKHIYSQIHHLEEQLDLKNTALHRALESSRNAEMSLNETVSQVRNKDDIILSKDETIQQLETKVVKLENDMKKEKQVSSQCKVLEAELGSKNTELKLVNQSLHDTQTELDDAMIKIDALSREIVEKDKDILDIDLKLKQALKLNMSERGFNEIISSMQTEIADMEGSVLNERAARKKAEEDSESFQIKIRSLEVTLREKMTLLAEKEADIKNLQKIINYDQVKSSHIEELENKLHEVTHSLNVEIQDHRMAKRDIEKRDIKIQSLESSIQKKDASIAELENTVQSHNVSEVSDRIMAQTIKQLENQLVERDGVIQARNNKIKTVDKSLQDAFGRIRELESEVKERDVEIHSLRLQKQKCESDLVSAKNLLQSAESKLANIEKQNATLESRTKLLLFEKHEASNKVEALEKVVQDMAESTLDSATSVQQMQRLTQELSVAGNQLDAVTGELETMRATNTLLRDQLAKSDEEIKKLTEESHANFVAKKAVNIMVDNLRTSQAQKAKAGIDQAVLSKSLSRSESQNYSPPPSSLKKGQSSRRVINAAASFSKQDEDVNPKTLSPAQSFSNEQNLNKFKTPMQSFIEDMAMKSADNTPQISTANGVLGQRHDSNTEMSKLTDFINATTRDCNKIREKKNEVRSHIEQFTTDFKAKHNRQPTAEEKAAAPDNIFSNYQQLTHILKKKVAKLQEAEEKFEKMRAERKST